MSCLGTVGTSVAATTSEAIFESNQDSEHLVDSCGVLIDFQNVF